MKSRYAVEPADRQWCQNIAEQLHYSQRFGIFWEGYRLTEHGEPIGMIAYGQPSAPIQRYAFRDRDFRLYELTRLVIDRDKLNAASYLIAHSLRQLRHQPAAVISYADTEWHHAGVVYQATNWLYTGAVTAHDSLYLVDGERVHPMTLRDRYGITKPVEWARQNGIERIKPKPKHRYIQFVGTRSQKRYMRSRLNYAVLSDYPKLEKQTYEQPHAIAETAGQPSLF